MDSPTPSDTPFQALMQSFTLILVSEIGDKTFLIAAIMATRHPRLTVFSGAFASLLVMSVLSAAMGKVILGLIPARYTQFVAAFLFLIFGINMIREGLSIPPGNSHIQTEMREVEDELEEEEGMMDFHGRREALEMEEGIGMGQNQAQAQKKGPTIHTHPLSGPRKPTSSSSSSSGSKSMKDRLTAADLKNRTRNLCSLFFSPVFAQAFILTFLGEWGDRSQIATIALAGANSVSIVAFGTIVGHAVCTAGAVIGGRLLSTRISVRHITLIGAAAFLFFAGVYFYEGYYGDAEGLVV